MVWDFVRKIRKNINGEDVYIEVCDENGFTTVNPKCYSYLNDNGFADDEQGKKDEELVDKFSKKEDIEELGGKK